MSALLTMHISAVAFWFGVVGAETVIERSRADSRPHGYAVARNHFWIDVLLEIPAATVVLVTGIAMLGGAHLSSPIFLIKISAGIFAVGINALCVIPVALRKAAAEREQLESVIRYSRAIDRISVLGIPAGIIALLIGLLWR